MPPLGTDNSTPDWMAQANAAAGTNVPMTPDGAAAGPNQDPLVLWGYDQVRQQLRKSAAGEELLPAAGGPTVKTPTYKTADEATLDIYTWNDKQLNQLADRLISAGLLSQDYSRTDLISAWGGLVKQAQAFTAAGKPKTPWDVIAWMGGSGGGGQQGHKPQTQKQIHISTPEQARAMIRDVAAARWGRAPTEAELDRLQAQLNQAQRANPTVQTTTWSGDNPTTTSTGGLDEQDFLNQRIDDFGAEDEHYNTVTRLIPALYQSIMTPI